MMVAIREVPDYDTWTPQTETTLDLRLGIFTDEQKENELICRKSVEMGVKLKELHTQASYISAEGYAALVKNCPNLEVLNLCVAYKTGDTALKIISGFDSLRELNLNFACNEPCIESRGTMSRCADLSAVEDITDVGVEAILNNCMNLRAIDLSGTRISVKTLELIASKQNITTLKVGACWNLTRDDIAHLRAARPDIVVHENEGQDATVSFFALKNAVAWRYYSQMSTANGGIIPALRPGASEVERDLISPMTFLN